MSTLTGTKIKDTYPGLIKIEDNGAVQPTVLKTLTDGTGGTLPLSVSQIETKFTSGSLVDFTGTTVTGLAFDAGMVAGTGANSVQSNVTGATGNASSSNAIAIGNGASASGGTGAMAYGQDAVANGTHSAAFGQYAEATNSYAISFGRTSVASGDGSVAFGQQTSAAQAGAVAMGRQVTSDTADTTHVRALKIVAPDGGTGGNGITFLSPNGTAGVVTLTDTSELALDGTAIGGGGGGTFETPLSPARKVKTTTNNFWNFAMPQDGNNYDGGGLSSQVDFQAGRRYFTQIYSDTVTEFALLLGPDFTGTLFAELYDAYPTTGMPRTRIATTGAFTQGSTGTQKAWHTGSFPSTETLNYEKYYIAFGTSTDPGTNGGDFNLYSSLGPGGYINRLVQINVGSQQPSTNDAIDYVGGGMNDSSNVTTYAENYDFSYRIDMFNTILFKQ